MKRSPFIILLFSLLVLARCKKNDNDLYTPGGPGGIPLSDIIRVDSLSSLSLEADGISTSLISIRMDPGTDSIDRFVVFHASIGQFPNGAATDTARTNAAGLAVLPLLSNVAGKALISANAGGYTVDTTITFTQALPDAILMSANKYTSTSTDSFQITATLFRNPGKGTVTDPVKVSFSVSPATLNGVPTLVLPAFGYSLHGIVTIPVQNPYKNTGTFVIQASTTADNGSTLTSPPVGLVIN